MSCKRWNASIWVRLTFWHEICIVRSQGRNEVYFFVMDPIFFTQNVDPWSQKRWELRSLNPFLLLAWSLIPWKTLLIPIPRVVIPDPEAVIPDPGTLIPDSIYLVTTLWISHVVDSLFSLILPGSLWSVVTSAWRRQSENGYLWTLFRCGFEVVKPYRCEAASV